MSSSKSGDYEFKREVLTDIRKKIGLFQGKIAELLGVPPNTRRDNGDLPDANSGFNFFPSLIVRHYTGVFRTKGRTNGNLAENSRRVTGSNLP